MQFKVPQDVQREDRIVGPLTLKQLIILGAGGGTAYAVYITLSKNYFIEVWLPPVAIISILTAAFAFLKVNNRPFHIFLLNFLQFHILPKKRIWIKGADIPFVSSLQKEKEKQKKPKFEEVKQKPQHTLEELSKIIDTGSQSSFEKKPSIADQADLLAHNSHNSSKK